MSSAIKLSGMIFLQRIPWRVMALPTPILLIVTLLPPLPLVYFIEMIRSLSRKMRMHACAKMIENMQCEDSEQTRYLVIYSARQSSQALLEKEVWPSLSVRPVLWENGQIADARVSRLTQVLPVELGNRFPVLIEWNAGALQLHSLHDCVYAGLDQTASAGEILVAMQQRIDDIEQA